MTDPEPLAQALAAEPLPDLMARARIVRDGAWGRTVTYSRKVFVPLTNMCRDTCGYCAFVKHPDHPEARIMSPRAVLASVRAGAAQGCKEALFSLGEKPERRHPEAKRALRALGHDSMTDYLKAMCALVRARTPLLPHVNAGTLSEDDIRALKPVAASMGMMLESTSRRLTRPGMAHHACPDKQPIQRLRTLDRAGRHKVPFTTGLLIGIGETWTERVATLLAIEAAHRRHGHVQEVIVQNFRRKPGIAMANHPEPGLDDMRRTIAAARVILSPDVSLQAPPNLSARHIAYLEAGINDWGGLSPVTIDFINPRHAWPEIGRLSRTCAERGYRLEERLTVYPNHIAREGFLDAAMRRPVADLARTDGLARRRAEAVP